MVRVLFIEDEPEAIEPILADLGSNIENPEHRTVNFEGAEAALSSFSPDVVVLDLIQHGASADSEPAGKDVFDFIWEKKFCPVLVFSAHPELIDEQRAQHPFVRCVKKGRTGRDDLFEAFGQVKSHVSALQEAEVFIRDQYAIALRDVAPRVFNDYEDDAQRRDVIVRAGRRRLAALMDEMHEDTGVLAPWEQYVSPPISTSLQLGDILRVTTEDVKNTEAYRLILTPSCDLVQNEKRSPKVSHVLAAKCCSVSSGISLTSLQGMGKKKLKDRLPSTVLTQGSFEGVLPLPALTGCLPGMFANLKALELIELNAISDKGDKGYMRVTSLDSPFRELIAWAYMQVACRPGLPDRDSDSWADEIVAGLDGGAA